MTKAPYSDQDDHLWKQNKKKAQDGIAPEYWVAGGRI
jgi:hypothetical protein